MRYLLETKNIKKTYQLESTTVSALKGISLRIAEGEYVVIGGASGSGKSTLLHILGCLDSVSEGDLIINDNNVTKMSDDYLSDFRALNLGFVFQTFNLLPVLTVYENVAYPLLLNRTKGGEKEKIENLLEEVGLQDFRNHYPNELSGGQRQRVATARALVNDPKILIADEPTANLDSRTGEKIIQLIITLSKKNNATTIIASHDPNLVATGERVIMMKDGLVHSDKTGNS